MDEDVVKLVKEAVCARTPAAMNPRITRIIESFMDGSLYLVDFDIAEDGISKIYSNRVYVNGKKIKIYGLDSEVLSDIPSIHKKTPIHVILERDGVAGIIALSLTLMIGLVIIRIGSNSDAKIPEILSNALTMVLGFYFGKSSKG